MSYEQMSIQSHVMEIIVGIRVLPSEIMGLGEMSMDINSMISQERSM